MQSTTSGPASIRVFNVIGVAVAVNVVVRHFLNVDAGFHTIVLALPALVAIGCVLSDSTSLLFVFGFDGKGANLVDGAVNGNGKFFHILKFSVILVILQIPCRTTSIRSKTHSSKTRSNPALSHRWQGTT